ncbi:MAG: NAD(P)H-dependent glycerol-3-phosphate dehydrogenase [Bacteroidia bacterium]
METVGVIGAGSFGTAIANMLAENRKVLVYTRNDKLGNAIANGERFNGWVLHPNITATQSLQTLAETCYIIFPIVPSSNFRQMLRDLSPFLRPDHIMIHGTKGLDVILPEGKTLQDMEKLQRRQIKTMSEVILEESVVRRVGCISGPNLAKEILAGHPSATVVASRFDEVKKEGIAALRSSRFRVHDNYDLLGIELAGVLKNIMAVASGIVSGLGYGENTRGMLIARGMAEIAKIGTALGANPRAFLGVAGIGDLVATCNSPFSRNYTVGIRLAEGEKLSDILASMTEVAEGVKTIQIAKKLADNYKIPVPITQALYRALFEDLEVKKGIRLLMEYPFTEDVEFI